MRADGCAPWSSRKLLVGGYTPGDCGDVGFAMGGPLRHADDISERDRRYDEKLYSCWVRALAWACEKVPNCDSQFKAFRFVLN
eukprot:7176003-Alexandrium_andersonii.AAC.1